MAWLEDLERTLGRFNDTVRTVKAFGADPRDLTYEDTADWQDQARTRTPPKTRGQIISAISSSNPFRYARLRRDYKWLEKQAKRNGLSPEDARWLF